MKPLEISPLTQRRFIIGMHGLYPGRRWKGKADIIPAIRAIGGLQVDPLNVIARSHDITLWGRIQDYKMADLDSLLYTERQLFDWGGLVQIYPMDQLPYYRVLMERRKTSGRYLKFCSTHAHLLPEVLNTIRERGPLMSADFERKSTIAQGGYRTTKDTGQALYQLWLTGELMTHSRKGFQRVYDLFERVAPPEFQQSVSVEEAEHFFARQVWDSSGIVTERGFRNGFQSNVERPVTNAEAHKRLQTLLKAKEITPVHVTGRKDPEYFVRASDLHLLEALHKDAIPDEWRPLSTTTADEVVFLSPLDMVSARGRARVLFDFEYIWEVYKPVEKRRWGYYTLPVLYQDSLVARLDPKLDRETNTLHLKGLWLESDTSMDDPAFTQALGRGLRSLASFVGAQSFDLTLVQPDPLRVWAQSLLDT